jgi:hypothetical protein
MRSPAKLSLSCVVGIVLVVDVSLATSRRQVVDGDVSARRLVRETEAGCDRVAEVSDL